MSDILSGQLMINGVDVWTEYGVFLTEKQAGGRENLTSLLQASATKEHVGVSLSDSNGKKYSSTLEVTNDEREFTLTFAQYALTKAGWLNQYKSFISFLKAGKNGTGWLEMKFPSLGMTFKVFYLDGSSFEPLTYLWKEGVQASRYKIRFKEPQPEI